MAATPTYTEAVLELGQRRSSRFIEECCDESAKYFSKVLRGYVIFHCSFCFFILFECAFLTYSLFTKHLSYAPAIALSGIFLTVFSYLVLIYYLQAKKPEQFVSIKNSFTALCKQALSSYIHSCDYHLSMARAAEKLASSLEKKLEQPQLSTAYEILKSSLVKKFRHFIKKDIITMQELLLLESVRQHVSLIKKEPTDLEAHASLSMTYLSLAKLHKKEQHEENSTFRQSIERAIEELKILKDYIPKDPWVHAQLAACYHDLGKNQEEIEEYEMILKLRPDDQEIMHRLGILYFQQGQNSKGLKLYNQLLDQEYPKAKALLNHYDAYTKAVFPYSS